MSPLPRNPDFEARVRADVWARRGDGEARVAAMQQTLMVMHGVADERI